MSTLQIRILIALSMAAVLLIGWGMLRALGPAHAEDATILWSAVAAPDNPHPGDTIEVVVTVSGAQSPLLSPGIIIEQDNEDPVVDLIGHEDDYYTTRITLHANHAGTATLRVTAFFEKQVCTEDPPPPMPPCFPHGFYATSPDIAIEVAPSDCGDANGDGVVNSLDATWTLQYAAGLILTIVPPWNLDVNGDGNIDALDATIILQHAAGLIPAPTCA
jgi:hypothetical protein